MGRIKTCLRYMTDITGSALFDGVWGGGYSENEVFVTYEQMTRS